MSQKVYQLNSPTVSNTKPTLGRYFQLWNAVKQSRPGTGDNERFAVTRRVLRCVPRVSEMSEEQLGKMIRVWEAMLKTEAKKGTKATKGTDGTDTTNFVGRRCGPRHIPNVWRGHAEFGKTRSRFNSGPPTYGTTRASMQ